MNTVHPHVRVLLLYGGSTVLYTALVFRGELPLSGARILSRTNTRPLSNIVAMHIAMIGILVCSVYMAVGAFPYLPDWLTYTISSRGAPISTFEFLFVLAFVGISMIERKFLYREAKDARTDSNKVRKNCRCARYR